jgi:hypothetical protein
MATSPNYGWSEPDNTSLVKDGAQAMRTLGDAIDTSVWNVGYGQAGKNKIINGAFDMWQRGTSFTSTNGVYTADRYSSYSAGTGTFARDTTYVPTGITYAGKYTSSGASGQFLMYQTIETANAIGLAGQTVTLSFYLAGTAGKSFGVTLGYSTTTDAAWTSSFTTIAASSGSTSTTSLTVTRYNYQFVVPSTAKTLQINISSPLLNNTEFIAVTGIQLEVGSKATPFQTASGGSIQGELAMCQRYYNRYGGATNNALFNGTNFNTTSLYGVLPFPVEMRVAPTVLASGPNDFVIFANNTTYTSNGFGANEITTKASRIEIVSASLLIQGQSAWVQCATGNKFIETSAEL